MNRICQGKVTNVEVANPDKDPLRILSASIPLSHQMGEGGANATGEGTKPDEVSPKSEERNKGEMSKLNPGAT